jgi:hypothetical protein
MPFDTLNSKCKRNFEDIEHKIYSNHQDEWYVYHSDLSWYVSDCTVIALSALACGFVPKTIKLVFAASLLSGAFSIKE